MGYNTRQLKASPDPKAPAKPKDVIVDPKGQWKHRGKVTKIPGDTMATHGYGDIPLWVVPDVGPPRMVQPNTGIQVFHGANSFTEYPITKNAGWLDIAQDGGTREPIITNDPKDPRIRAYDDSLKVFKWNKKALADVIKSNKTPGGKVLSNDPPTLVSKKQQVEIELQKAKEWGLNLSKKDILDDLEHYDGINKGTGKLNKAVSYFNFNDYKDQPVFKLAQYKKPVQPYLYQPPEPPEETPPVKKDTVKTVVKPIESDTTRKWDFNGSVPAMQYFDKAGKRIGQDYYQNIKDYNEGKKIDIVQKQVGGATSLRAVPTYASEKEQNKYTPYQRMVLQARANNQADREYNTVTGFVNLASHVPGPSQLLFSGLSSAVDFTEDNYAKSLLGLVPYKPFKIADAAGDVKDIYEQKKGGSVKGLSKFTSKNIKTSVNKLQMRNETLFGERGRKIYHPDAKGWLDNYK